MESFLSTEVTLRYISGIQHNLEYT